ncbi:MAG: DNA internalization-related competence protein ComEC/Rec2 [Deltaproteobacteria bacterium]|nr:DNA internalization-related competence protein ComEC/Rec2 [Deltaproteobacteria bacterium]
MYRTAPFIPFLGALITGIIAGSATTRCEFPVVVCACIVAVILLVSTVIRRHMIVSACIAALFFCIGFLHINLYLDPLSSKKDIVHCINPSDSAVVEGIITEPPRITSTKTELIIDVRRVIRHEKSLPVEGRVLLSVYGRTRFFNYGNYIRARTKLRKPENFGNPGAFDYERYLRYRGIRVRGSVNHPSDIVVLREYRGNYLRTCLEEFRSRLRSSIASAAPGDEGIVLQALILGDSAGIPDTILDDFNRTGVTHIIAISGFNIGIVAFLAMFLARTLMNTSEYLLLRFNRTHVSTGFALIPIIIYTFIAGCSIATVRATLMIVAFLIALLIGRDRSPFNTLALVALAILMLSPPSLFDISFQLSFIAVASLIFALPPLQHHISQLMLRPRYQNSYFLKYVLLTLAINLAATLGTLPVIVYYFNRISTVSLPANFFIVPLIGFVAIPLGVIFIILTPFSTILSTLVLKIASFVTGVSLSLAHAFATLPYASVTMITPTLFEIILFYACIVSLVVLISTGKATRTRIAAGIIAATAFIFLMCGVMIPLRSHVAGGTLEVTFLDVGQGSSTFIRFPGGHTMLIDGGGFYDRSFDTGRFVVAPFLWHAGISRIDTVVLSHPDEDHSGGLPFILENFGVREVWTNRDTADSETFLQFMKVIREKNICHTYVCSDTSRKLIGGAVVSVLNPPCRNETGRENGISGVNDDSIVVKITYNGMGILITSDIDEPAEERFHINGDILRCTVMTAPHHGARTSSSVPFIAGAAPEIAIFSCGINNVFGFPSPETLTRYLQHGVCCFRTDRDGAITVNICGDTVRLKTWKTQKNDFFKAPFHGRD